MPGGLNTSCHACIIINSNSRMQDTMSSNSIEFKSINVAHITMDSRLLAASLRIEDCSIHFLPVCARGSPRPFRRRAVDLAASDAAVWTRQSQAFACDAPRAEPQCTSNQADQRVAHARIPHAHMQTNTGACACECMQAAPGRVCARGATVGHCARARGGTCVLLDTRVKVHVSIIVMVA